VSIGYPGSEPRRPGEVKELAVAFVWVRPKQLRDEDIRVFYIVAGQASDDEEPGEDDGASDDAEDDTGAVLGDRFELLEAIAWGGTAAVYRARDRVTKAEVAVKVLCSGVRAQLGRYFGQEGRLAAQLCNPHLVRAHHFGVDDGRPFIVFDLVPGRSLPALYFKQPMPWRELCEVVLGLLDALGTMHAQGIVHRDVKPDNLVVWRRPNHPDHVTLLDVGFAAVPPERNMTNAPEPTRMVFGTHGYIAPELFAGHLPDPRSDLYSVGALMYEMLTSLPVTDLSNAPEILAIAPPRVVAPGADIPEAVEDVVMQALSDIEARFQSATAMAAAIREALAPTPRLVEVEVEVVVAVPVPVPIPVEVSGPVEVHQAKRRTWLTPAALSLGIVLGGGGMFGLLSARSDVPRESTVAVETPTAERGVARAALGNPDAVLTRSDLVAAPGSAAAPSIVPEVPSRPAADPPGEAITKKAADKPAATTPAIKKRVPAAPSTVHSFSEAMARLEPAVRRCAKENRVAQDPVNVEVRRGSGLDVDSVRVWDMSTQHPFARCVDKVIRGAPRLPKGAPVESFEFFDKASPSP
jgi:hypothetical protein